MWIFHSCKMQNINRKALALELHVSPFLWGLHDLLVALPLATLHPPLNLNLLICSNGIKMLKTHDTWG